MYVSVVVRTTPPIRNPTQDSQFPSFVPETTREQKIYGLEDILGKTDYEAPINDVLLFNEDLGLDPYLSFYYKWGVENMRQSKFHGCIGENVEENRNAVDEHEEEVDIDDNYDHLSQLRVNKKVDKLRDKRTLQVAIPEQQ